MPIIADLALLLWFPLSVLVFIRMRPAPAAMLVILGAALFLPEARSFDLPLVPSLDASRIGLLSAFLLSLILCPRLLRPRSGTFALLAFPVITSLSPLVTVFTNREPLFYGPVMLPGLTRHDAISTVLQNTIDFVIPFYLGLSLFRRARDLRFAIRCLAVAGLIYSLLILVELRMSPQLHRWVYGYHQHQFLQTIRGSGFRPMVFMPHGLALASFVLAACTACWSMWSAGLRVRQLPSLPSAFYMSVLLVACKSLAAIVYGVVVLPLAALAKPRTQVLTAVALAMMVLLYPAARAAQLIPVESMVALADKVSTDRARSLEFRLSNEELLLQKALQRRWFGWGTWGRNRIYDEYFGTDVAVSDGAWIIDLGTFGIVGFIGRFGLLTAPIFAALLRLRAIRSSRNRKLLGGLTLIVAFNAVDLLPNGFLATYVLFLGGALTGIVPGLIAEERAQRRRETPGRRSGSQPEQSEASGGQLPPQPTTAGIAAGLLTRPGARTRRGGE